ncbi:hypothetical protein MBLNU13_g09695t1 [Cladosporium sp. NU13]
MAPSDNNKMWKKRYLIPLWVVQLIVLGIYFVLSIVGMSAAEDLDDYLDSPEWNNRSDYADQVTILLTVSPNSTIYRTTFGVIIAFSSLCILLVITEIILAASHRLKPTFHLVSAVLKALIAVIYFIIVCIGSASVGRGYGLDIVLSLALTVATLLQVVYGAVRVHRVRKGVYSAVNTNGGHGAVAYKGQGTGDVELQSGGVPVYR